MANSAGVGYATKQRALAAVVDGKTLKAALYLASATTGPSNSVYTGTGEVAQGGGYLTGGVSVTNGNSAALTSSTAYWTPSASISFGTVTIATAFDAVMIYDAGASNANIGVFTFGSQTVTNAPFSLTMPTNDSVTALIRLA